MGSKLLFLGFKIIWKTYERTAERNIKIHSIRFSVQDARMHASCHHLECLNNMKIKVKQIASPDPMYIL